MLCQVLGLFFTVVLFLNNQTNYFWAGAFCPQSVRHPDFPTDDHFHIILSRRPLAALAQLVYTCVYQFRDNWKSLSVLDLSKEVQNNDFGQEATKISEFKVGGQ